MGNSWLTRSAVFGLCALLACASEGEAQATSDYQPASSGTRELTLGSGTVIKMLLDASVLGTDAVEVAEITFPAGASSAGHRHGAMEMFYVVEGVLGHVVNGVEHRLEPGMAGVVKPSDEVEHRVLEGPLKVVVIWVPGGEGDRIAPRERWRALAGG
jgi:quercetin dioxygenase-like cupin family protein